MFAVRVNQGGLEDRLDAGYYHPKYLRLIRELRAKKAIKLDRLANGVACGPFGGNAIADDLYALDGVPFIRPVNISSNRYDDKSLVRVPKSVLMESGLKIYEGDNLFFGRVGVPCVALISGEASISPNIIIVRPDASKIDPFYLFAFSSSNYGIRQLERMIKEVAQPTTSTDSIRELLVVKMDSITQKYIGDKLRLAERLRFWARQQESNFCSLLKSWFPSAFQGEEEKKIYSFVSKIDISIDLNPGLYAPERIRTRKSLLKEGGVKLSSMASIDSSTTDNYCSNNYYLGLDGISSTDGTLVFSTTGRESVVGAQRKLLSGPVISKLRPYLNKVAYVPEDLVGAVGSTELLNVIPKNDSAGWFIYGVLKQTSTIKQLNPIASGATHPRVSVSDILDLVIPWIENAEEYGEMLQIAFSARQLAIQLSDSARYLVEALIEGKICESQVINAHSSLENGTKSVDRSILTRLTTNGLDGDGPPLFPALDQLYYLLDQATQGLEA